MNVLAVMDRDAELALSWNGRAKPESQQAFRESQEARAAVAELIAAGMAATEEKMHDGASSREACERLIAALSRVRGAE